MRRALVLIGIIGLGVLVGFLVRLVWPHRKGSSPEVYYPPGPRGGAS